MRPVNQMVPPGAGNSALFSMSLPGEPTSVAHARRSLRQWLAGHGVAGGVLDDVVLCADEAVTNAIEHGYRGDTTGEVRLSVELLGTAIVVTVLDHGHWRPAQDGLGVSHGWGLPMIKSLAETMAVTHTDGHTTLTARFRRPG
ncbi:Anti-sigma regulatory factor (Ser/Thr protein kinase) [Actinokineospora diospyrosa]|uniref:Anti-sigma regulatory factor (Ser/Thr protein kinase) n=1 Tax=Actinokineospora diospyrosa TaxID=103728 RepID=A0ABT1IC37_9PSEU|nr:Anti-sigma regulatory factor (Ser/Thr protein kinase) [Actinokineospora diospyrosa]